MRNIAFTIFFLTTINFFCFSQTNYTLSSGCTNSTPGASCNWAAGTSWVGGVAPVNAVPASGDVIVIPQNTFVQIEEVQITISNPIELQVFGEIFIYSKGNSIGNLRLASASVIKIASSGDIEARQTGTTGGGTGNADKNFLTIGSETIDGSEINDLASPNQVTEATMASGNAGCAETGTCEENPLPIQLAYFNVVSQENSVKINWVTTTEENNDYFEILRSRDGVEYDVIGTTDGAGNSSQAMSYEYIDKNPFFGQSYYRLKQTDFDGKSETFSAKSVYMSTLSDLVFSPNPVESGNKITVYTGANSDEIVSVKILTVAGKTILSERMEGGQNDIIIPSEIERGVYFLKVVSGDKRFVKRLLIK